MSEYSVYSDFNIEKHKEYFTHYLEVLILKDGTVRYAVPSHQELAVALACEALGVLRQELEKLCPREFYGDYLRWLLMQSGAVAVWEDFCFSASVTKQQETAMKKLKVHGLYRGTIPKPTASCYT